MDRYRYIKERRIESTMITYEMITKIQTRGKEGLDLCSVSKNGGKVLNIREFVEVKIRGNIRCPRFRSWLPEGTLINMGTGIMGARKQTKWWLSIWEIANYPNVHSPLYCTDGHPARDFISQSPLQQVLPCD